jgi:hypothetical protein
MDQENKITERNRHPSWIEPTQGSFVLPFSSSADYAIDPRRGHQEKIDHDRNGRLFAGDLGA